MTTLWWFDPFFEAQLAWGGVGFRPKRPVLEVGLDLQHLALFTAQEADVVAVHRTPSTPWLNQLKDAGFRLPRFMEIGESPSSNPLRAAPPLRNVEPWGWTPESHRSLVHLLEHLSLEAPVRRILESPPTELAAPSVASKDWGASFLRQWLTAHPDDQSIFGIPEEVAQTFSSTEDAFQWAKAISSTGQVPVFKAPLATAGRGIKRVLNSNELEGPLGGWIHSIVETQGHVLAETFRDKVCDLSVQLEVHDSETRTLGVRCFETHGAFAYAGTHLGGTAWGAPEDARVLVERVRERWHSMLLALGEQLRAAGYRGPVGVDAMVHQHREGSLPLHPLVELNPRWTLGRVALALEERLAPGTPARWSLVPRAQWERGTTEWAGRLAESHPVTLDGQGRLTGGIVLTSDPSTVRQTLTLLAVGRDRLHTW